MSCKLVKRCKKIGWRYCYSRRMRGLRKSFIVGPGSYRKTGKETHSVKIIRCIRVHQYFYINMKICLSDRLKCIEIVL